MTDSALLHLIALDPEDLAVVSAHIQDAVVQVRDLTWLKREKRFVIAMNRFVWEAAPSGFFRRKEYQRRRSVLHFDRVWSVQYSGLDSRPDRVLSILALRFQPNEPPSGQIDVLCSGGATLRISVECIEAQIADLGPAWSTSHAPRHKTSAG